MISIKRLKFTYPRSTFKLQIDDLSVGSGEKLAIIGPSGSGKTTLLNLLSGIEAGNEGSLTVAGTDLTPMSDSQRRDFRSAHIGFVFQQFELLEYLNVADNITLPFMINQSLASQRETLGSKARVVELAESMGIGDKLNRHPEKLSQGEKQRVAICRALVADPQLILADEPTGNLDPANKSRTLDLLFQYARQREQTLIVVTHDMTIVDGFDRVIDFAKFQPGVTA